MGGASMVDGELEVMVHRRVQKDGPGPRWRLSALSVFHSKSFLYGGFVWACSALNNRKRRCPARADSRGVQEPMNETMCGRVLVAVYL
jgi:hypothetical protein